jgi:hypothetical protein
MYQMSLQLAAAVAAPRCTLVSGLEIHPWVAGALTPFARSAYDPEMTGSATNDEADTASFSKSGMRPFWG